MVHLEAEEGIQKKIISLVKLGINEEQARGMTWCQGGYQFIAHSCVIKKAISNTRFEESGLVQSRDLYLKIHTIL